MDHGPILLTFRRYPKTESSAYVMPMSASSDCTCVEVMGSSSAVGVAVMKAPKIERSNEFPAHLMNFLRSTLLIDPMGFSYKGWCQ